MTRALGVAVMCACAHAVAAQTPPVPRPFPGATTPTTSTTPKSATAPPAAPAPQTPPSADILAGAPVFPGAEYLDSTDAGRGQRYYLYGTSAPFLDIVAYYRKILNNGGNEVFKAPAIHRFDLPGKFQEETMAFPPSVVVKDYTWGGSEGYLFVDGTREKRYRTIIQIVPSPPPPIK